MLETEQLASASRLLAHDTFDNRCPLRPIMDQTTSRFAQLHARVGGISQKMLSQNLKALARAGLVTRHVAPTNPPQVTYSLTELGVSLAGPLTDLFRWFGRHGDELLAAQQHYDSHDGSADQPNSH